MVPINEIFDIRYGNQFDFSKMKSEEPSLIDEIDDANYKRTKNIPVEDISMTLNYESLSPILANQATYIYE